MEIPAGKKPTKVCRERHHMTPREWAIWNYAKAVSYKSGRFYLDGRALADEFRDQGKSTIYDIVDELKAEGWFVETRPSLRLKNGMFSPGECRILSHEEWVKTHPEMCRDFNRLGPPTCPRYGLDLSAQPTDLSEMRTKYCRGNLVGESVEKQFGKERYGPPSDSQKPPALTPPEPTQKATVGSVPPKKYDSGPSPQVGRQRSAANTALPPSASADPVPAPQKYDPYNDPDLVFDGLPLPPEEPDPPLRLGPYQRTEIDEIVEHERELAKRGLL